MNFIKRFFVQRRFKQDLTRILFAFIRSKNSMVAREIIRQNSELLFHSEADRMINELKEMARERGDLKSLKGLEERHALIIRCKEMGIEQAFTQTPPPPNDIESQIKQYRATLSSVDRDENPEFWASLQGDLGSLLAQSHIDRAEKLEEAINCYEEAFRVFIKETHPVQWAMLHGNLVNIYGERIRGERAKNIEEAIYHGNKALEVITYEKLPEKWALIQNGLASAHSRRILPDFTVDLARSISHYNEALRVFTLETHPHDWAMIQLNLAQAYRKLARETNSKHLQQAQYYNEQALQVYTLKDFPQQWALANRNLGTILFNSFHDDHDANKIEKAISYCEQALEVYTREKSPADWAMVQNDLGLAYANRVEGNRDQNLEKAVAYYYEALEILTLDQFPSDRRGVLGNLGTLHFEQGNWQQANDIYQEAILVGNSILKTAHTPIGQQIEVSVTSVLHPRIAYCLLKLKQPENALKHLDQGKTRLLAKKLTNFERIDFGVSDLLACIPESGVLVVPLFTSIGGAVFVLPHGTTQVTQEHVFFLKNGSGDLINDLLIGHSEDDGWLSALIEKNSEKLNAVTNQLWYTIVEPIYERLQAIGFDAYAPITIMPQGGLGLLPLHAAWRQVDNQPRYFCDDYIITYAPSAYAVHISRQRAAQPERQARSLFAAINPTRDLKYTPLEGEAIAQLFPSANQTILHEANATTVTFPSAAQGHTYIHYSGHGYYHWRDPLQSGLLLADKAYTLADILSGLDLSTCRLVTLSACETGITEFQQSPDEYVGLPAGFLQAGATAVISTLWAVNDLSTMLLMERFYQLHLQEGLELSPALRRAQLWLRDLRAGELADRFGQERMKLKGNRLTLAEAGDYWRRFAAEEPESKPFSHPYYWAAFTFTGA